MSASFSSIKKKLGHRSLKIQAPPIPIGLASAEHSIGWRLANKPPKSGLDTLKLVDHVLVGQKPHGHKKSSCLSTNIDENMYTKSSFGSGPAVTLQDVHYEKPVSPQMNLKSPKVMLVDVQMSWKGHVHDVTRETVANNNNNRLNRRSIAMPTAVVHSGHNQDVNLRRQGPVTHSAVNKYRTSSRAKPVIGYLASPDKSLNTIGVETVQAPPSMRTSTSQQSLSSILSNVSVLSTKSVFSVECNFNQTIIEEAESFFVCPQQKHHPDQQQDHVNTLASANTHGRVPREESEPGMASKTSSLDSLETFGSEEELKAHQKLKKSTSVDSGRGASLYDSEGMYKIEDIALMMKNLEHLTEQANIEGSSSSSSDVHTKVQLNSNRKYKVRIDPDLMQAPVEDAEPSSVSELHPPSSVFYSSLPKGMSSSSVGGFYGRSHWQYSSCTLPGKRSARSQTFTENVGSLDASRLSNSVVQYNVEFDQVSEENTSPLKFLNRSPLRFSSRVRRKSYTAEPSKPLVATTKPNRELRKCLSSGAGIRSPKFPLTSLVKSISSESGLSRFEAEEQYDDDDDDDEDDEEEIIKPRAPTSPHNPKSHFNSNQSQHSRFHTLTPCQENDHQDALKKLQCPKPLTEKSSENILLMKAHSLTPLHLAKCTKVRMPGKKTIKHKYRSPSKSKRFSFLSSNKSKDDAFSTPKSTTKSPKKYPCSPVNPLTVPSVDLSSAFFCDDF